METIFLSHPSCYKRYSINRFLIFAILVFNQHFKLFKKLRSWASKISRVVNFNTQIATHLFPIISVTYFLKSTQQFIHPRWKNCMFSICRYFNHSEVFFQISFGRLIFKKIWFWCSRKYIGWNRLLKLITWLFLYI